MHDWRYFMSSVFSSLVINHPTDCLSGAAYLDMLEQYWPDMPLSARDATQLEALFDAFGVPLRIEDLPLAKLQGAYDVLSLGFVEFVKTKLLQPDRFAAKVQGWHDDWVRYVVAVANRNRVQARELAMLLDPLGSDTALPPRLYDALYE